MSDGINFPKMVRVLPDTWIQPAHVTFVELKENGAYVEIGLTDHRSVFVPTHDGKLIYDDDAAIVSVINFAIQRANGNNA